MFKSNKVNVRSIYLRLKSLLPDPIRDLLSGINQRLCARRTLIRKHGRWFDVDWRKKYRTVSDEEWIEAYDRAWKYHTNDCVEETDAKLIASALESPGSVLEVGCGMGSLAIRLAQQGFRVSGLDVSAEALTRARSQAEETGLKIDWHQGFAEKLPFADRAFDYVTCCHTLEHVRDLGAAVEEFKRVAKQKVVVLVPKQKFKMYADNYHTQFFESREQLTDVFGLANARCIEIDCTDHSKEFQGKALLYIGTLNSTKMETQK